MDNQFLLFAGDDYYPRGGANDFIGSFKTKEDAKSAHSPSKYEYSGGWANIFDLKTEKIVMQFYKGQWCD